MKYIENTYLLFSLSKLDYSVRAQLHNPQKVYAIDNALVPRLGFHFSGEEGRLLENMVYIELRRRGGEFFYHNSGNAECNFVVRDGFRVVQAIQACCLLGSSDIREREIRGIQDAMDTYQLLEGTIITNSHEEEMKYGDKMIHVLLAWKWLHL